MLMDKETVVKCKTCDKFFGYTKEYSKCRFCNAQYGESQEEVKEESKEKKVPLKVKKDSFKMWTDIEPREK